MASALLQRRRETSNRGYATGAQDVVQAASRRTGGEDPQLHDPTPRLLLGDALLDQYAILDAIQRAKGDALHGDRLQCVDGLQASKPPGAARWAAQAAARAAAPKP